MDVCGEGIEELHLPHSNALHSRLDGGGRGPYAVGPLASEGPGPDNFCDVPELGPARLEVPASSTQPAQSFSYEWSGLRVYNTPEIPGTQFIADLRYTENGCTADYTVRGIWPVVSCGTSPRPGAARAEPHSPLGAILGTSTPRGVAFYPRSPKPAEAPPSPPRS